MMVGGRRWLVRRNAAAALASKGRIHPTTIPSPIYHHDRLALLTPPGTIPSSSYPERETRSLAPRYSLSDYRTPPTTISESPFSVSPSLELQEGDDDLVRSVYEWIRVPFVEVKLYPQNTTLIYQRSDIAKYPLPVNLESTDEVYVARASRILQVFCVSLKASFDDERPCQIHGSIRARVQATDGADTTFSLYDRASDECETILKHGNLSLSGPEYGAISCPVDTTSSMIMEFHLIDHARNIEIIKSQLDLHSKDGNLEDSYDRPLEAVVQGKHGYVYVNYTKFRLAVFASVMVAIFEHPRRHADLYGSIVASYPNLKQWGSSTCDVKHVKSKLFETSSDEPVNAMVGSPIPLARCVVAVPAYSSLIIEADLICSKRHFAKGYAEFPAQDSGQTSKLIGACGVIVVDVIWSSVSPCLGK